MRKSIFFRIYPREAYAKLYKIEPMGQDWWLREILIIVKLISIFNRLQTISKHFQKFGRYFAI